MTQEKSPQPQHNIVQRQRIVSGLFMKMAINYTSIKFWFKTTFAITTPCLCYCLYLKVKMLQISISTIPYDNRVEAWCAKGK